MVFWGAIFRFVVFFKQKAAYEMRISDWSSDVCSSDLERAFSVAEARTAREAFLTSSTSFVLPVTQLDGKPIGNGHPGILTGKLRQHYLDYMQSLKKSA